MSVGRYLSEAENNTDDPETWHASMDRAAASLIRNISNSDEVSARTREIATRWLESWDSDQERWYA